MCRFAVGTAGVILQPYGGRFEESGGIFILFFVFFFIILNQ